MTRQRFSCMMGEARLPTSGEPGSPVVCVQSGPQDYGDAWALFALVKQAIENLNLGDGFIKAGDHVVLKPNWVKEHDERRPGPNQWEHVVTHPAIIEGVIRWVAPRMGQGRITICDAPQTDSSFATLRAYCQLDEMIARCRQEFPGVEWQVLDLRAEEWQTSDGVTVSKTTLAGDPKGSTQVNLDDASEFVDYPGCGQLYGASYDMQETNVHHQGRRHEYLLCRTPMEADVLINLPKLKTHKKVGITCALKNLVGINANKNWLPHHTEGTPEQGGDQFPDSNARTRLEHRWMGAAKRWLSQHPAFSRLFVPVKRAGRLFFGDTRKVVRSGNWHGNDTCWRMVLDLNKCLFCFDGTGRRRVQPLRYLSVVDGIIGGEGNGPMAPDRKPAGVVVAGVHPLAVDLVAASIMGFDWQKLRLLRNAFAMRKLSFVAFGPGDVRVISNCPAWSGSLEQMRDSLDFRPHFGWVGAIESERWALTT